MASMGMMNEGYFVGRKEIIEWLNGTFKVNIVKIEELGSGAMYCQIIHSVYPDVPLHKVKFNAKLEPDHLHNFKVLQKAFEKHGVDRYIEVDKLAKKSYQQNLEMIQFMKAWHDANSGASLDYDAEAARAKAGASMGAVKKSNMRAVSKQPLGLASAQPDNPPQSKASKSGTGVNLTSARQAGSTSGRVAKAAPGEGNAQETKMLQDQLVEMKLTIDGLEKERDFYFGKLRDIELYCQEHEEEAEPTQSVDMIQKILTILYQTEDNFVDPAELEDGAAIAGSHEVYKDIVNENYDQ